MADYDIAHAQFDEHRARDFSRIGSFCIPVDILCAQHDACPVQCFRQRFERRIGGANHHLSILGRLVELIEKRLQHFQRFGAGFMHFPIASNDDLTHG